MKIISCFILMLMMSLGAQSQIFKKMSERASDAAERAVLRKTDQKASSETDKAMEKMFDMDFSKSKSNANPDILPKSYDFTWRYTLKMTNKKGDFMMHYFLKKDAQYFGSKPEMEQNNAMGNMVMVFDPKLKTTAIFMDMESGKRGQMMNFDENDINTEQIPSDYTFKKIGTKEIMGYQCQGYEMENDEYQAVMYVALDAPVSFNQMGKANAQSLPEGFDPELLEKMNSSLMMEMQFTSKKNKKYNSTITCVKLVKEPMKIVVSDYEFLNF